MGRVWAQGLCFVICLVHLGSPPAEAYTPTLMSNGAPVRWNGNPRLNLAGNPGNQVGMDAGSFGAAVVKSLSRWKEASLNIFQFEYWQGGDKAFYDTSSGYNGMSNIYFTSNGPADAALPANVLGLTQVWYNTNNGEILETDIALNDRNFRFTTNPRDTSGYGATDVSYSGGHGGVFIENVLTHELGHALGLSHSGGLQSTMLFMESPEQAHLACDDQIGIQSMYGGGGSRGSIVGRVRSESGAALFGAQVVAVSRRRGTVLATAMTDKSGNYRLDALEAGSYFLMVEPFFAGGSALPAYYSRVNMNLCSGGEPFARTVLMADEVTPFEVKLPPNATVAAPEWTAQCGAYGGAALSSSLDSDRFISAPTVYEGGSGFGVAEKFLNSATTYYRLNALKGRLEMHALSYSLYSPVRTHIALLDEQGALVPKAMVEERSYVGDSGYVNHDSILAASDLAEGTYFVRVTAVRMDANLYPAPIALDTIPFVVLTGSVNEASPPLATVLPDNARCRTAESYPAYSSPGGQPPRRETAPPDEGTGFCGSVSIGNTRIGGPRPPSAGAIAGWFAPWLLMLLIARIQARVAGLRRWDKAATLGA